MRPSAVSPRRNTNQTAPKAKIASPVPRLASNGDGAGSTFRSSGVFRAICTRLFAVMAQCEMRQPPRCSRRRGTRRQARRAATGAARLHFALHPGRPEADQPVGPNAPPTSPASSVTPAWSRHPAQLAFSRVACGSTRSTGGLPGSKAGASDANPSAKPRIRRAIIIL